jgi:hypothetical protein
VLCPICREWYVPYFSRRVAEALSDVGCRNNVALRFELRTMRKRPTCRELRKLVTKPKTGFSVFVNQGDRDVYGLLSLERRECWRRLLELFLSHRSAIAALWFFSASSLFVYNTKHAMCSQTIYFIRKGAGEKKQRIYSNVPLKCHFSLFSDSVFCTGVGYRKTPSLQDTEGRFRLSPYSLRLDANLRQDVRVLLVLQLCES